MRCIAFIVIMVVGIFQTVCARPNATEIEKAIASMNTYGEIYFFITPIPSTDRQKLLNLLYVDNITSDTIYAYATKGIFQQFLLLNIDFTLLPHPGEFLAKQPQFSSDDFTLRNGRAPWDKYPTYDAYIAMTDKFATDYPELCQIVEIGKSVKGKSLRYVKISDNVTTKEPEPRFMYSSSMHGDEVTGAVLLLRLAEYLLSKYSSDEQVKKLVDNMEIWLMPFENPDGTYGSGTTISSPTRSNANGIDLNRSYPNPKPSEVKPAHETKITIAFTDTCTFTMSANFHGGAEVVNYPWDNFTSKEKIHADDKWFIFVSRLYADLCQKENSTYMKDQNNGITNGGDWYVALGSRQDFFNSLRHCKEVTLEVSPKFPGVAASALPNYWNWNYKAMLAYMEQCLYGIHGKVTADGKPVMAKVFVENYDKDSSWVYSKLPNGDFHRPLKAGTYDVTFSATGFPSKTIKGVSVKDNETTVLDVALGTTSLLTQNSDGIAVPLIKCTGNSISVVGMQSNVSVALFTMSGKKVFHQTIQTNGEIFFCTHVPSGVYLVNVCGVNNAQQATQRIVVSQH